MNRFSNFRVIQRTLTLMRFDETFRAFWVLLLSLAEWTGGETAMTVSNGEDQPSTSTDDSSDFAPLGGRTYDQSGWNPPCDPNKPQPCGNTTKLQCINYGRLYHDSDKDVHICDCEIPDPDSEKNCTCTTEAEKIYSRWDYQEKPLPNPPAMGDDYKIAAAGYKRPGCYLEYGETCRIDRAGNEKAETYFLCKHGLYCKPFKGTTYWGFCVSYAMVTSRITWLWPFVLVLRYPLRHILFVL